MDGGFGKLVFALTLLAPALGCGEVGDAGQDGMVVDSEGPAGVPSIDDAQTLRAGGRAGLVEALELYDAADRSASPESWERFVDQVAGARDASRSRLFWETDMERAKAEAARRGLPILSLRLLGDLRDELSCANSRLFRTLLYADPEVAAFMDASFVLHWSSERPVPQVRISLGDGRVLETTTTGNSIHYVMDADGRVVDAIPGLYGPGEFRAALTEAVLTHASMQELEPAERLKALREHHKAAVDQADKSLAALGSKVDPFALRLSLRRAMTTPPAAETDSDTPPPALAAQVVTFGKSRMETPLLRGLDAWPAGTTPTALQELFTRAAPTVAPHITFSEPSLALIRRDRPRHRGESEADYETRLAAMVKRLRGDVAADQLQNAYHLRVVLHEWFASGLAERPFEEINAKVYETLFLTPASDPWVGLLDEDVYDGLEGAGVAEVPG